MSTELKKKLIKLYQNGDLDIIHEFYDKYNQININAYNDEEFIIACLYRYDLCL